MVLHPCVSITKALPLIIKAGYDALDPMEVKAECDPFAFADQYGDDLAFIDGLDMRILESNDRETICRGVSEIIEGMKARNARYVFGTDRSVTPNMRYDSYRYALEFYEAHWDY